MTPPELIENFRRGHEAILLTVSQLQSAGNNYPQARPLIIELRERLAAHVRRQGDEFFDSLRTFYAEDRKALKLLEYFVHDLKDLKIRHLIFFEKHSEELSPAVAAKGLAKDFKEFSGAVIGRLKMEEEYLLPLIARAPVV